MIRKLLPLPWMTLALVVIWQMLVNAVTLGSLLLGLILGVLIPLFTAPYWPDRPRIRNLPQVAQYILIVLWDIVLANIAVAQAILFKKNTDMQPGWIVVPLDLRAPEAITILAATITMTPGTVSSELAADGRSLLVHYLDASDPDAVLEEIKTRYERRLKEIFE